MLANKAENSSSMLRTHMVEGEKRLRLKQFVLYMSPHGTLMPFTFVLLNVMLILLIKCVDNS